MQEITLDKAKGLKFANYVFSTETQQAVLTFEGDVFITLGIDDAWEACDREIEEQHLERWDFGTHHMLELGIITTEDIEERDQRARENSRLFKEREEKRERDLYEKLKGKFEV